MSRYYSASCSRFRVLFKIRPAASGSVLSVILKNVQGIIQLSFWFTIQRIIQKCRGYYSASGSLFRVLFKIRPAASGSGFSILFKSIQGIIQRLVHYSGYYSKYDLQRLVQDSAYYKKCPGYYSASGSVFKVFFNIRPAASGSRFSVLLKNVQGIFQRLV